MRLGKNRLAIHVGKVHEVIALLTVDTLPSAIPESMFQANLRATSLLYLIHNTQVVAHGMTRGFQKWAADFIAYQAGTKTLVRAPNWENERTCASHSRTPAKITLRLSY
jgi:hypothetical protein